MITYQYDNLSSQSRLKRFLAFQHTKNVVTLSYIEKIKICEGEISQLPVLLVQQKCLKFRWLNASLTFCNKPYNWPLRFVSPSISISCFLSPKKKKKKNKKTNKQKKQKKIIQHLYPVHLPILKWRAFWQRSTPSHLII